ncbi:zinc finger protein 260-like isoform X2 [Acanthopagrus latus]|uniref:zinc finger protein 260-like isoform X2 n=1 Tax=Acanthopagrus latus TaxID=8177 RepID=UPI00187CE901|nr:zinc finger protein 260-like isoform X2 [Acanthopagrus latus]
MCRRLRVNVISPLNRITIRNEPNHLEQSTHDCFHSFCIMTEEDTIDAIGARTDKASSTPSDKILQQSSVFSAGVQQLMKEEVSPEWSPSLDQKDPEPLHIKEEQEELLTSQEGSQVNGPEEADITMYPLTAVTVKSEDDEDDEEKPPTSQLPPRQSFHVDVQQLLVIKEEVSSEWSPSLDQEDSKPLHIKEEQEELWTSQEGKQVNGLEGADITRYTFTAVIIKSEDVEEKPQTSQLNQSKTEKNGGAEPSASSWATQIKRENDGEDRGGSEPDRNRDQGSHPQSNTADCPETEVNSDWKPLSDTGSITEDSDGNIWLPEPGVNAVKYKEALESNVGCTAAKKKFSCFECRKGFLCKLSLQRHMKSSTCLVDKKSYPETQSVDSQIRVEIGKRSVSCDDCGKRFETPGNLRKHMRFHTRDKPFGCVVCGKGFTQKGDLNAHKILHTGQKPFACDVCGKRFPLNKYLKTHMIVHTREKQFGCDVCGTQFSLMQTLKRHMLVHNEGRPFGCDVCGKRFPRKKHVTIHMRVHTGERPFGCADCDKRFAEEGNLKRHMRVHTGEKTFCCTVCGIKFKKTAHLRKHMKVHTGEKPFACGDCGRGYNFKQALDKHMQVHTGETPFFCNVCGKIFHGPAWLKSHMRIHSEEKPYDCHVCGKSCSQPGNLKKHMRVHTEAKTYTCDVCSKTFRQLYTLKRHMTVHTGEKPYSCDQCSKRFRLQESLKKHMRVHSG